MHEPTDTALIERFQKGDSQAFTLLYNHLFPGVSYFAGQLVGDVAEAEDIVSESFIKLYHNRHNFNTLPNIRVFLYITTRNACFDLLRARRRHHLAHKEIVYLELGVDTARFSEEEYQRLLEKLYRRVENLPGRCREVFRRLYFDGLTTAEVARVMELSPQTVLNQKSRAIQLLRKFLAGEGPGLG